MTGGGRTGSGGKARGDAMYVVVVEDDPRYREYAAEPFRKRGDRVLTTSDGLEALRSCLEEPPDVVLSDVQMPRMDGWQLLRMLRSRPTLATVPVVFLTGLSGEAERLRGYQLGVEAYVPKPYDAQELVVRVHRIVMRARGSLPMYAEQATMRGELEHASPPSLVSFLAMERSTGTLLVVGERVARVFFRDGRVVRAVIEGGAEGTQQVLMTVLDWSSGQFEFTAADVPPEERDVAIDVNALVLEFAQKKDEAAR